MRQFFRWLWSHLQFEFLCLLLFTAAATYYLIAY